METVLSLTNVSKDYDKERILDQINFTLNKGQIVGLIGPSGAGKSTMIKVALGMEKADQGKVLVFKQKMPNRQVLGQLGYMAQSDALYLSLSGYENLCFFGQMLGIQKATLAKSIAHVAEIVDLTDHLGKLVSGYSGGMKRRLSLAIALLGEPDLLILDEPTVGIDPSLRKQIWRELKLLKEKGVAILVTTHVMDEAEKTDFVGLLRGGRMIAFDSPAELKRSYQVDSIEEVFLKAEGE